MLIRSFLSSLLLIVVIIAASIYKNGEVSWGVVALMWVSYSLFTWVPLLIWPLLKKQFTK